MESITIKASVRERSGKKEARQIRAEGLVPGVLYGNGEQKMLKFDERSFKKLVYTPKVYLVDLDIEGKVQKAALQDIQFNPVTDDIEHIDFYAIDENKPITIKIPVNIVGTSIGIVDGGVMVMNRRKLIVRGLIKDLPDEIDVDITNLNIGDVLKISDISVENLEMLEPPTGMIVAVKSTRAATTALPEDLEPAEGEETDETDVPEEGEEAAEGEEGAEAKEEGEGEGEKAEKAGKEG